MGLINTGMIGVTDGSRGCGALDIDCIEGEGEAGELDVKEGLGMLMTCA